VWSPAASAANPPSRDAGPWTSITFGPGGTGPAAAEVAHQYQVSRDDRQRGQQQKIEFLRSSAASGTYLDIAALDYLRFERPDGEVAEVVSPRTYEVSSIDFGAGVKPGDGIRTVSAAVHGTEHPDNDRGLAYPGGPGFDSYTFVSKGEFSLKTSSGTLNYHWEKDKDVDETNAALDKYFYTRWAVVTPTDISGPNDVVETMGMRSYPTPATESILRGWAGMNPMPGEHDGDCSNSIDVGIGGVGTSFTPCATYTIDTDDHPSRAGDMSFNWKNCTWVRLCDHEGKQSMAAAFGAYTDDGHEPVYLDYVYVNFMTNSRNPLWFYPTGNPDDDIRNHTNGCGATGASADCTAGGSSYMRPSVPGDGTGESASGLPKAEPAMVYDQQNGQMKIYRWYSTGANFTRATDYQSGNFDLANVGDRVATGDVDGDGHDDTVMAYQNSDGTFGFHVWKSGKTYAGIWYTSGIFSLSGVAGRLVVGDFNGDGKAEPALVRDEGGVMTIYRWTSTGSSFTHTTDYHSGPFSMANVGNRVAAGDVNGDGKDDIVMAYQLSSGAFAYYVFLNGLTSSGQWYSSGTFSLTGVQGRMVVADFNGDGKAEPALARDEGTTMKIYRWTSTGSSFSHTTDYTSGTFELANVGDRVASDDVTGDGKADIVMAYQNSDGTWDYHVFDQGSSWLGKWYPGGQFNMNNVQGRLVVGTF
jgi:hypothetical protein